MIRLVTSGVVDPNGEFILLKRPSATVAEERLDVPGAARPCTYTGRQPHPVTGEQSVTVDPLEPLTSSTTHPR